MRSSAGYTLIEVLIVVGLIGIVTAISVPVFIESTARNRAWTASESIGAQIRQTRLRAISRNTTFQVRFDCPGPGQFRSLVMTGDPLIDDDVNRCNDTLDLDSGTFDMPSGVSYDTGGLVLQVTGRGIYSSTGGHGIPETITVSYGTSSRTLTVSATGQITFSSY